MINIERGTRVRAQLWTQEEGKGRVIATPRSPKPDDVVWVEITDGPSWAVGDSYPFYAGELFILADDQEEDKERS